MKKTFFLCAFWGIFLIMNAQNYIPQTTIQKTISNIKQNSKISHDLISRGVHQAAALWTSEDGTSSEFADFCITNFCTDDQQKLLLFNRLCHNFESIIGHANRVTIDLSLPIHVSGYQSLPIDERFAAYDGLAHLSNDMFNNKIAFIIILNFPHYTLKEKTEYADKWSDLEWGFARLGDLFTSRIPAEKIQAINAATAAADHYISNYNIHMGFVRTNDHNSFWSKDTKLISHWGLRDELKAAYADTENGLKKQKLIYDIMLHIIDQTIPVEVIDNEEYLWYPTANKMFYEGIEIGGTAEKDVRYQYLLNNFRAESAADSYYTGHSTFLSRRFNDDLEIFQDDIERLFVAFLSQPEIKKVANLISQKLNRKLQPFDIWYNGFKNRTATSENDLDVLTRAKYPTKDAFVEDLPNILHSLGFSDEKAQFICQHVTVDASVGAGHAWEAMMRDDNARLRTRIGEKGMDYKGFNIGIHEFGHNVEQTFSLHNVPNYFLKGVPNTAFTEAVAFAFQQRDLQLLGVNQNDTIGAYYDLLDNFWSCYEIMGVSLLDIHVWQWMYAHPKATASELKTAVLSMAKDIWNKYYAPIFKVQDQTILAVYSHMIDAPLYLCAYPIGYLISFQLENHFKDKNLGTEVERLFSQGRLIPQYWLKKGIGKTLTVTPFVRTAGAAVDIIESYEKAQQAAEKKAQKNKK